MKIDMSSVEEMLTLLKSNPNVLGLVEYGSSREVGTNQMGDYDLSVILQEKVHEVESLHFYVDKIPVDLNIRSLQEIQDAGQPSVDSPQTYA